MGEYCEGDRGCIRAGIGMRSLTDFRKSREEIDIRDFFSNLSPCRGYIWVGLW